MLPLTTASALASADWRRPSRLSTASLTAREISWVSVGSGVWLSNGSTATVLMEGGRPPPAKPYRQPVSVRMLRLTRQPDIRRKGGPFGREKGQVELGRRARHSEPCLQGSSAAVELGFRSPYQLALLPHSGDETHGVSDSARVLDRVGGSRVLPSRGRTLGQTPKPDSCIGHTSDSKHRPHEWIVGDHLGNGIRRLGPERTITNHYGGCGSAPEWS